jgi:hypothetical protein
MGRIPRVAVLFALPTDRDTFLAVARGEVLGDYRNLLFRGESAEAVWQERYTRVAEAARDLIAAAADVGTATTRATLSDLAVASRGSDVVIVLGHWRGWAVAEADLRMDLHDIAVRFRRAGFGDLLGRKAITSRLEMVRALNAAIEHGELLARTHPDLADGEHPTIKATLGRDILDELLGVGIAPGNRVELFDGLHTPAAFEEALDPGFRGDLDLATCSSIALATLISMRRGRSVQVVHTVDLVDPLLCLITIRGTLCHLLTRGGTYAEARLEIESQLGAVRQELIRERQRR